MALERIDWPRQTPAGSGRCGRHSVAAGEWRTASPASVCCSTGPTPTKAIQAKTILHTLMARGDTEQVPDAEMLLDHGARIDIHDELLQEHGPWMGMPLAPCSFCEASVGSGDALDTKDETR